MSTQPNEEELDRRFLEQLWLAEDRLFDVWEQNYEQD